MSLVAVLAVVFGLKQIAQDGIGAVPVASIAIGVVVGILWTGRQLASADPMIDLRLFRIPSFNASLVINFLTIFVAIGYFLFVAQYLQLVVGLSPLLAGLCSVPSAIGFIVGSNLAPPLVRRYRPANVMGASLVLAAAGLVLLTQVGVANSLVVVIAASVVIALGLAPVLTLTTDIIVGSAPPERAGAASGGPSRPCPRPCPPQAGRAGPAGRRGGGPPRPFGCGGAGRSAGRPGAPGRPVSGAGRRPPR